MTSELRKHLKCVPTRKALKEISRGYAVSISYAQSVQAAFSKYLFARVQ